METETIAIDLLWLRPHGVGGTEYYIRNLLDGFQKLDSSFSFVLVCTQNNVETFRHYEKDSHFHILTAPIDNANISGRILWQWFFENHFLRKNGIRKCFCPVYCRPLFNGGIQYINTIHDLQVYHYPQYHPLHEVIYTKLMWLVDRYFSRHIIAISDFVKDDLHQIYGFPTEKITRIYNPIIMDVDACADFGRVASDYHVNAGNYYYTIGQLIPHKNMETLIRVFGELHRRQQMGELVDIPCRLVLSGIKGNAAEQINELVRTSGLEDVVILTGFVTDEVKVALYKNCRAFLLASVFEGFGMPPIEAMKCGVPVITTNCACIPEVTQHLANYVDDPYSIEDWLQALQNPSNHSAELDFAQYDEEYIARQYLKVIVGMEK